MLFVSFQYQANSPGCLSARKDATISILLAAATLRMLR